MGKLIMTIIFVLLLAVPVASLAAQYRVHNIGSLIGSEISYANAINESGAVAVSAHFGYDQGDYKAVYIWNPDTGLNDISVAGRLDIVSDINDSGNVTGNSHQYPETLVIRQANGNIVDLSRLSGMDNLSAYTSSINNAGQVTGAIGDHIVFWGSPSNPIDISGDNGMDNMAIDLNNNGKVLWSSTWTTAEGTFIQPYTWTQNEGSTPLIVPDGAQYAIANAINDQGVVVGRTAGNAVKWLANGSIEVLPTYGVNTGGNSASGINNVGQIVGSLSFGAVLWNSDGSIIDLGSMLSGYKYWSGEYQSCATGINDKGWITGYMYSPDWSYSQAIVWEPVPEPSGLVALVSGLGCLATVLKQRRSYA